jgi:predicted outer membrane repeat protein
MFEHRNASSDLRNNHGSKVISKAARTVVTASIVLGAGSASAKTIYVNGAVAKPGSGATWSSAYKYLRDALDNSKPKDVIYVAKGVYYPDDGVSGNFGDRQKSFELKGQIIYGGCAGNETSPGQRNPRANPTVLSGAIWDGPNEDVYWSLHVVMVNRSSVLDGLTVADGRANGASVWNYPNISEYDQGGGCYVQSGATLTLFGCSFVENHALKYGGGIAVKDNTGKVVATNCLFERNAIKQFPSIAGEITEGGAIKGNVEATNCRFISNSVVSINGVARTVSSSLGGAISGDVIATRCDFTGNSVFAAAGLGPKTPDADPIASGGAVHGNILATLCTFNGNEAFAPRGVPPVIVPPVVVPPVVDPTAEVELVGEGVSSGGAIAGGSVVAVNCSFSLNTSATGKIEKIDGSGSGGGGAIYVLRGESSLVNCVFAGNTSEVRGGAIHSATQEFTELVVSNCTFVDNGVTDDFEGAALSCGGIVRMLNNVFWYSDTPTPPGGFRRDNLIRTIKDGVLRNSPANYPDPTTVVLNLIRGGATAVTRGAESNVFLGPTGVTILGGDPRFVNISDPDGADNTWGTADDGFRINAGSPAIGFIRDPRITDPDNFLLKDTADVDRDGNRTELIPVDFAGLARVQGGFVEMGAYEFGTAPNVVDVPEIAVFEVKGTELQSGNSRSFGSLTLKSNRKKVFMIRNTGKSALQNLSYSITGSKAFTLKKSVVKTLAQGSETKLTVTFKPTRKGTGKAKLVIASNDPDEKSFVVNLSGKGVIKRKKSQSSSLASITTSSANPTSFSAGGLSDGALTTTESTAGKKYLVLSVQKSAEIGALDPVVEVSSNLLDWSSGAEHTTVLLNNHLSLRVRDNTPVSQDTKRYIRVK